VRGSIRTTSRKIRRSALAALFLFPLLGVDSPGPRLTSGEAPAAGRYLVATEAIRGSIFQESVVYLVSHTETGSLGLIVNRPTGVPLREVVQGAVDGSGTLYLGGPVERTSVMMLLRAQEPPERGRRVADDVVVTSDADVLLEHTRSPDAGRIRVYAGYAGWKPQQLEDEISRGHWLVIEAPSGSIFEDDPDALWKKLFRRHHKLVASLRPGERNGTQAERSSWN
jgi:putative transcriptional regulator